MMIPPQRRRADDDRKRMAQPQIAKARDERAVHAPVPGRGWRRG